MWTNEFQPKKEYGFQVLLSVYNEENNIKNCLTSLDRCLSGENWILLYGDDGCEDDTTVELAKYANKITADKVHLYEFDKAQTVGIAKNRLVKEAHGYKKDYPYILFMDADDEMLPERPKMVNTAIEQDASMVVGAWLKERPPHKAHLMDAKGNAEHLRMGPWGTLIDCNALVEDEPFFPEDTVSNAGFEDVITWNHLKYNKNLKFVPHTSNEPVHLYKKYIDSVSRSRDEHIQNYNTNLSWGIIDLIRFYSRDIYENPPTQLEAEESMYKYIDRKKIKNADLESKNPLGED